MSAHKGEGEAELREKHHIASTGILPVNAVAQETFAALAPTVL